MKVKLREHFSVENDKGEVVVGPAELDLTKEEVELHAHKLEIIEDEEGEETGLDDVEKEISALAKKLCKEEVKGKSKEEKKQIYEAKETELNEEFAASGVELKEFVAQKLG